MPVSESDLELLEGYLDDALSMGEVELLRARLAGDAEFAAALEGLRSERGARRMFFAALEPDDAAVEKLTARVSNSIRRRREFGRVRRAAAYLSAAAACLLVGFLARGWFDRPATISAAPGTIAKVERIETYQVTLRDESGKVLGVQKFDSAEKAREFAADLARWQSRSEKLASGQFVLHQDRF